MSLCAKPVRPCRPGADKRGTLDAIIADYLGAGQRRRCQEDAWYAARGLPLGAAVERAALSLQPNERGRLILNGHQCRPGKATMRRVAAALAPHESLFAAAKNFTELMAVVQAALMNVDGAGPLIHYDVANRIGLHRGIRPDRVYLHAGARGGAAALGVITGSRRSVGLDELPPAFQRLTPSQAEDVLCIYKDELAAAAI